MEKMPDTYSGGNVRALRAVTTYEVVCLPQNAHGHRTGEVLCRLRNKAPEMKVSPMCWLVVPPLHRTSTLPDIMQP